MRDYEELTKEQLIIELEKLAEERTKYHNQIEQLEQTKVDLENSQNHFRSLFNTMVDPVVIVDAKGKLLDITDKVEQITHFKREELIGKNFIKTKIVTQKSKQILLKNLVKRMMGFNIKPYTVDILTKDGKKMPFEVNAAKITYKNQSADMVIFRNVTAREDARNKLLERDKYVTTILNTTQAGILVIDEETHKILDMNIKAAKMIGAKEKDIIGKMCHQYICQSEEGKCPMSDLNLEIDNSEEVLIRADKREIQILKTVKRSIINGKKCLIESFVDIGKLLKVQEYLKCSQTKYQNLFEYSPISLWLEDFSEVKKKIDNLKKNGIHDIEKYLHENPETVAELVQLVKIIDVNKTTLKFVEAHNKNELLENISKIFTEESMPIFIKEMGAISRGETTFNSKGISYSLGGKKCIVNVSWTVADEYLHNYGFVQVAIADITTREKALEKLIESEKKFKTITTSARDAIVITNSAGNVTFWNDAAHKIFGYSKDEIIEKSLFEFIYPKKWLTKHKKALEKFNKTGKSDMVNTTVKFTAAKKSGIRFPVELSVSAVEIDNEWNSIGIFRDITEQKQSERLKIRNIKLMEQKKEIEKANQLKSEFLSNMSHELRTPLNSVIALSRVLLMQSDDKLNPEELNYLEVIERNGKNLLALINAILDISKIEAGKMEVNPQSFSAKSVIETVRDSIFQIAENNGVKLEMDIPKDLPFLESDSERLHHIIQNLMSNAVKFIKDAKVTISANVEEKNMIIKVIDEGIGIKSEDIPHLFKKFKQADGSRTKNYQGTGLGLAIVSESLKLINGTIDVESEVGKGSTFTISLPLMWQGEKRESQKFVQKEIKKDRKTVLIVDDEPQIIQILADIFEDEGFNSIAALSGKEALEMAEKYQPQLITLDIMMPGIDGWEVLQKLKRNPKTSKISVVIISKIKDQHTARALGAIGYVSKPVHHANLMAEIRKINSSPNSVMVVDDNEFDLSTMENIIKNENIDVISADGGLKCLQLLEIKLPDILVLDLMMPDLNGFGVIEKLQNNPKTINLPVIIVTAKDLTKEDKLRLNGNVISILTKDENTSQNLVKTIKRILRQLDKQEIKNTRTKRQEKSVDKTTLNKILIIEDNPDNMITLKAVLHNRYEILEAMDGETGLKLAKKRPDLVLLDIHLPKMDGFQVMEKLRENKNNHNLPIIALTAMAMKGDREKILSAGFDGYMSKPIDPILLLDEIKNRLKEN